MIRRNFLRLAVSAGGVVLVPGAGGLTKALRLSDPLPSPRLTPFVSPLPIPLNAQQVAPFQTVGAAPSRFATQSPIYHKIIAEERLVSLHPQLPLTRIWGYRDAAVPVSTSGLGPTFITTFGVPMIVRLTNALPPDHVGFGHPFLTTHMHGAHTEQRSDGFAENIGVLRPVSAPGESYDMCYDNLDPGFSTGEPDSSDRPSTLWYHDHVLDFTAQNVYRGLVGLNLCFDQLDTGDETQGLQLPSGAFDVPLCLQDRRLDALGQLVYDPLDHNGFLGDVFLVNGAVQPFLSVQGRKYRFRFLNGCNARFLNMRIVSASGVAQTYSQIATESGLMQGPLRDQTDSFMSPAQRNEIVFDFSRFAPGTVLYLENNVDQPDGRGPRGTFDNPIFTPVGTRFLKFIVGDRVADPSRVPDILRPFTPDYLAAVPTANRLQFQFSRRNGVWVINGESVDLHTPIATIRLNTPQVWTFKNNSGGWWHPIHVHLEYMHVLTRNGKIPKANERGTFCRRDVVNLGPNDEIEAFFRFRDYPGRWLIHCHTTEHEDAFMMACFDVIA
jgi:FtsP/CotA-like multicopper oxidase with cupredoxin domain